MSETSPDFPTLLQDYFLRRLITQRGASQQTVKSYRDTFELLLCFAEKRIGRPSCKLTINDLDAPLILDFLDHLEQKRGNSPRTRNLRLTAIRSFMRYVGSRNPISLPVVQRILSIPGKRFDRPVLGFLSRDEVQSLLDAPDRSTWSGHRDAVLFLTLYNTGARVSEIISLSVSDVLIDRQSSVLFHGKGRKERVIPLWENTVAQLKVWLGRIERHSDNPVFPNRKHQPISRFGIRQRVQCAVAKATEKSPSLAGRHISPHTFRHTTAMHLLQSGVDLTVIALLLGHEDMSTTHQYLEADLAMKEEALKKLQEPTATNPRFRPTKRMLAFLDTL